MLESPFDVLHCSWPHSMLQKNHQRIAEPDWQLPSMPVCPQATIEQFQNAWYWGINWSSFFRCDFNVSLKGHEMRGFYVVFQVQFNKSGMLTVYANQQCIVRREGTMLYDGRRSSPPSTDIMIMAGESVQIAQWHMQGTWTWMPFFHSADAQLQPGSIDPVVLLSDYLHAVQKRLRQVAGPPLKIYTNGQDPLRTVIGIYSFILNGYAPSAIYLFGDYQWKKSVRDLFKQLLPFAQIIPVGQVLTHLQTLGGAQLVELAAKHWFVMKLIVALFYPPDEFCLMDDDVFVLDDLSDALEAFTKHHLVYTTNYEHNAAYRETWKAVYKDLPAQLPAAKFNAGFYWLRTTKDPRTLLTQLSQVPVPAKAQNWEQGFIAAVYADESCFELPSQRYFAPAIDGLPGGLMGYDYAHNPCEFACIHFLGVAAHAKPSDGQALRLLPQICKNTRDEESPSILTGIGQ